MRYEVPYKNATRDIVLPGSTSFAQFLTAVAAKMETRITHLSAIGYVPSYKPKSPKPVPKLLEDDESYEAMLDDIENYIQTSKEKNKGKGIVKAFVIRIVDTSGSTGKDAVVTSGKVMSSLD